jgi:CubicO group peptidase (beta-lactamase class C family)
MRFGPWILLLLVADPAASRAADPDPAAIDRVMADALKAWEVPGAALVVVSGDRTVVLKGYGRKHVGRPDPMTPDTVFPLASCTKSFTATLMAMLADDGKLGWDDPVRKHLPTFHLADPRADAQVTLRDLLAHRTGLNGHDLLWYRAPWSVDEVIRRAGLLPPEYPFRGGFEYSSIMYMAAGRAAAAAGGKPWEQLVRERITGPLGMSGVTFTTKDIPPSADRATGHRKTKAGSVEPMPWYEVAEPNPAGSMNVTARDLEKWLKLQLAGGVWDGKRLVSEKNLHETRSPQNTIPLDAANRAMNPDTKQLSYGMGWVVSDHRGKKVVAHGGMIDGFRVQITFLPDERLGFAVLNNLDGTRMNQAVTNTLIDVCCGLPARDWNRFFLEYVRDQEAKRKAALEARDKARKPGTSPTLPLAGYAGEYVSPAYGKATVTADGGRLVFDWSGFSCLLGHYQDDVFRITEGHLEDQLVEFAPVPGRGSVALQFLGFVFMKR